MKRITALVAIASAAGCGTLLAIEPDAPPTPVGDSGSPTDAASSDAPIASDGGVDAAPDVGVDADGGGPKYRVFATRDTFAGTDMGDSLTSPDARCAAAATAASLPGIYVAWISTDSLAARDKDIGPGPWVTLAGNEVARNAGDVNNGILGAPIDIDEQGATLGVPAHAWTGSSATGQIRVMGTCQSGFFDVGPAAGGNVHATNDTFRAEAVPESCTHLHHLYCFQKP